MGLWFSWYGDELVEFVVPPVAPGAVEVRPAPSECLSVWGLVVGQERLLNAQLVAVHDPQMQEEMGHAEVLQDGQFGRVNIRC